MKWNLSTHLSRVDTELGPLGSRTEHINAHPPLGGAAAAVVTRRRRSKSCCRHASAAVALLRLVASGLVRDSNGPCPSAVAPHAARRASQRRRCTAAAAAVPRFSSCGGLARAGSLASPAADVSVASALKVMFVPDPRGVCSMSFNTREVMPSVLSRVVQSTKRYGQGRRSLCASGGQFRPATWSNALTCRGRGGGSLASPPRWTLRERREYT